MADTKKAERIGVAHICSEFQFRDIMVAEPLSDCDGADLIAAHTFGDSVKFIRLQSKYRTIKKGTYIRIPVSYVKNDLVVCLVLATSDKSTKNLYCFLPNEIKSWPTSTIIEKVVDKDTGEITENPVEEVHSFYVEADFLNQSSLKHVLFDDARSQKIKALIRNVNMPEIWSIVMPVFPGAPSDLKKIGNIVMPKNFDLVESDISGRQNFVEILPGGVTRQRADSLGKNVPQEYNSASNVPITKQPDPKPTKR